jgi:Protein of unknown function (DUF4239)
MGEWLLNLPIPWMTFIIFAATYLIAACVYLAVVRLAVDDRRARAFKALSPAMLPPLGVIFGLLVGFVAVQVWNDFDNAKLAVATEASALRSVVLLAEILPDEQRIHVGTLVNRHIDEAVNQEWPAMAQHRLTLASSPTALLEALQLTLLMKPQDESQRGTQREMVAELNAALDAWHRRISISQSGVGPIEWAAILLMGLCMLIAIAIVHSDNRSTCAITVALFATTIALSALVIAAYSRPFSGAISVGPELLKQIPSYAGPRSAERRAYLSPFRQLSNYVLVSC